MATPRIADSAVPETASPPPDDGFLMAGALGGDGAAFAKLIERYDRLVRFTIFRASKERCLRDPQWLDSIACDTWAGFVQSLRRAPDSMPTSMRAYLVRIARNKVVSALRGPATHPTVSLEEHATELPEASDVEEPVEALERLEVIESLRDCLARLDPDDRTLASQLEAMMDRRWRDAAAALDLSESTLRSRWKRTLGRLRGCLERKTGRPFAPGAGGGDS